jgi:hypothetical protein
METYLILILVVGFSQVLPLSDTAENYVVEMIKVNTES